MSTPGKKSTGKFKALLMSFLVSCYAALNPVLLLLWSFGRCIHPLHVTFKWVYAVFGLTALGQTIKRAQIQPLPNLTRVSGLVSGGHGLYSLKRIPTNHSRSRLELRHWEPSLWKTPLNLILDPNPTF